MFEKDKIKECLSRGIDYHQAGQLEKAQKLYEKVLDKEETNPDALNLLGVISLQTANPQKAVILIRKAVSQNPNNPGYLNNLGQALQAIGEKESAISHYRDALEISPKNTDVLNNLGIILTELEHYENARVYFEKAIAVERNNPDIFHNYAIMLQETGKFEEAIQNYRAALKLNPNLPSSFASLASAFEELGRRNDAIGNYWHAIKLDPLYLEAHIALKKIRWSARDDAKLHDSFHYACKVYPHSMEALCNLANSLLESHDTKSAEVWAKKAIKISKDYAPPFYLMAQIYHSKKNYTQSIHAHKKAINLDRGNSLYREGLGHTLSISGNFKSAVKELILAHKLNPRRSGILGALTVAMNEINDPRLSSYLDYKNCISTRTIKIPKGFKSLTEFNAALHLEISEQHDNRPPPLDQTMRGGTQIPNNLFKGAKGLTAIVKEQLTRSLKEYIKTLEFDESHPFLRFINLNFRYTGAWSTILYDSGYDMSHIHNEGWISGVYYIKVPKFPDEIWDLGEGCIQFGEPPTQFISSKNQAQRIIKPEEGLAVFFPSYYWHGVRPFKRKGLRHAIAFDII